MPSQHSSTASAASSACVSNTSTLEFEHVPYEEYVTRVQDLVHQRWPAISREKVVVERLRGGSFNRVIGFSFELSQQTGLRQYVLRIPRYDEVQVPRNVASVRFVQGNTDIPIPDVEMFDSTTDNPLQDTYMMQIRAPGQSLQKLYPDLSHAARCTIAQQLGSIVCTLLSVQGPCIGSLASPEARSKDGEFLIETIYGAGVHETVAYRRPSSTIDISAALTAMFEYRRKEALEHEPEPDEFRAAYMRNFIIMTAELSSAGYLSDVPITLCHMDLEARNILAYSDEDNKTGITAVIDWDAAIFAPSYMACKPPSWIWSWTDDDDLDEVAMNNVSLTTESYQLKEIFGEAAGPIYERFAYQPQYRLARRLMNFATTYIGQAEQLKDADKMLAEWVGMKDGKSDIKLDIYDLTDNEEEYEEAEGDSESENEHEVSGGEEEYNAEIA